MLELGRLQIIGFGVIVFAAVAFMVLERIFPYNPGQKLFREGFWMDMLLYNLGQSYLLGVVISWIISGIDRSTSVSRLHLITNWPIALQVALFLVTHDLYIYWAHRTQHKFEWLWKIHEAHHATDDVDFLSGVRSHPIEILINQTIEFMPIVLLGAAPQVAIYKGMFSAIWGMYIHSNLDVSSGRLEWVINGPEMHRWHHADGDDRAMFKNFSTKLAIWDWMFGTAFLPIGEKSTRYGINDPTFPKGYFGQVGHFFVYSYRRLSAKNQSTSLPPISPDHRAEHSAGQTA